MKVVIQRVNQASVTVNNQVVGSITKGLLVLVGITASDKVDQAKWLANKISKLRIFNDENGKMNLSLQEVNGSILAVSQFTLYGDSEKSNRPSFTNAAKPELANQLYEQFKLELQNIGLNVQSGIFGADMQVSLINDGPVTIILEK